MKNEWEEISNGKLLLPDGYGRTTPVNELTHRMRVHNGWLVRSLIFPPNSDRTVVTMVFVFDEDDEWAKNS